MGEWNDAGETIVAGTGEVYVADTGTSLPALTSTDLDAVPAWFGLGYHSEDGVGLNFSPEFQRHNAWQARKPIRINRVSDALIVTFGLLQWNEKSVPLAFGGGSIVPNGGEYKYVPPAADDDLDERALVVDADDGDRRARVIIPRGAVTEALDVQLNAGAMSVLPISFEVLEYDGGDDFNILFGDSVAFAAGS